MDEPERTRVRRGAFLNLKRIALFFRVPRGTGVESKLPSVRTNTVGFFWTPVAPGPVPFFGFCYSPPSIFF